MSIFDRFKKKVKDEATLQGDTPGQWNEFWGSDIDDEKLKSATYYACMKIRCDAVAKLPLKIMELKDEDSVVEARKNPLYRLLRYRPNDYETAHDFIWATEYEKLTYGDAYWWPKRNARGNKIISLHRLPSQNVSTYFIGEGIFDDKNKIFYIYQDPVKGQMVFREDELLHFKNFPNGIKGTSVQAYLTEIINSERSGSKVIKTRYESGLQDPIIVQYEGDLNKEIREKIRRKFSELGGTKHAGQVIPISAEFKVSQLQTNLVNEQFFELQGLTTKHIANAFGVKSFQLNDLSRATYANIAEQNRDFYQSTLINVLSEYEQEIDCKLLGLDSRFFSRFNVDSLLRSTPLERAQQYESALRNSWMSVAEVRRMEQLPHVDGTEILICGNGASIPFKDLGKQYGSGGEDDNGKGGEENAENPV
jgi:HK97 family phage portal protein